MAASLRVRSVPEMAHVFCHPSDWLDHVVAENGGFLAMQNMLHCIRPWMIKVVELCVAKDSGVDVFYPTVYLSMLL